MLFTFHYYHGVVGRSRGGGRGWSATSPCSLSMSINCYWFSGIVFCGSVLATLFVSPFTEPGLFFSTHREWTASRQWGRIQLIWQKVYWIWITDSTLKSLAVPLKDSQKLVLRPHQLCLGWMLQVSVWWKVIWHSRLRSCALWRRVSSRFSLYLTAFIPPSVLTVSVSLETHPEHNAATTILHRRDGISEVMGSACYLPDIVLEVLLRGFSFCLISPGNLFPCAFRVL